LAWVKYRNDTNYARKASTAVIGRSDGAAYFLPTILSGGQESYVYPPGSRSYYSAENVTWASVNQFVISLNTVESGKSGFCTNRWSIFLIK
jgi:hypothetical protein